MLKQKWPVIYAGVLMSITAFSIDITLPAIPAMAREFDAPVSTIQLTISLFVLALGVGQLFWGVFSDRYGRKPAILGGIVLFVLASVAAAFSSTPEMLIASRVVQGLGASAAGTTARAMIRDLYSGKDLAANMATATTIFAIGPILGPFIGAAFLTFISWRAVFLGLAVLGALLLVGLYFMSETSRHKTPVSFHELRKSTAAIMGNRQSRFFLLYGPVIMSSMIFILSMVPAMFEAEYGVEGLYFAALFALFSASSFGQAVPTIEALCRGLKVEKVQKDNDVCYARIKAVADKKSAELNAAIATIVLKTSPIAAQKLFVFHQEWAASDENNCWGRSVEEVEVDTTPLRNFHCWAEARDNQTKRLLRLYKLN